MAEPTKLTPIYEMPETDAFLRGIDHSRTKVLGYSTSSTHVVYEQRSCYPHILQSTDAENWTQPRYSLAKLAEKSSCLVNTRFMFRHENLIYVVSQKADMCLADLIPCVFGLLDEHVSLVIRLVVGCLLEVASAGIGYNNVSASNVFVGRTGQVQLANFDLKENPQFLAPEDRNSDCQDVGHLTTHLLTRSARKILLPQTSSSRQGNMVTTSHGYLIEGGMGFSAEVIDFLDACMNASSLQLLANHPFLRVDLPQEALSSFVEEALESAYCPTWGR